MGNSTTALTTESPNEENSGVSGKMLEDRPMDQTPFFTPAQASKQGTQELHRQLSSLLKRKPETEGFSVELISDNLYKWRLHLFDFPPESPLSEYLELYNREFPTRNTICLEIVFPANYPAYPPFFRVVYPRFHNFTGHITAGGSICVQDLTLSGWTERNELYQFIIMIRNLLMEGGALINLDDKTDYSEKEAKEAFARVARFHGWET